MSNLSWKDGVKLPLAFGGENKIVGSLVREAFNISGIYFRSVCTNVSRENICLSLR